MLHDLFFFKVISVTKTRIHLTRCVITYFTFALPKTCLRIWLCSRCLVYKVYILSKKNDMRLLLGLLLFSFLGKVYALEYKRANFFLTVYKPNPMQFFE